MKRKFHTTRRTRIVKKNQTGGGYSLSDIGSFFSRINPVKAIGRLLTRSNSHHTHRPSATAARHPSATVAQQDGATKQEVVAEKLDELEDLLNT